MGTKQIAAFAAHAKDAEWVKDDCRPIFPLDDIREPEPWRAAG